MKKNVELSYAKMFNNKYLLWKNNLIQWMSIRKIKIIYRLGMKNDETMLFQHELQSLE